MTGKLKDVYWCGHCGYGRARPRAQTNPHLCAACNAYVVKYDRLPVASVLHRRLCRREQERYECLTD